MDQYNIQKTGRNKIKKIFLFKNQFSDSGRFFSEFKNELGRNSHRGHVFFEMLLWSAILIVIAAGFLHIHKSFKARHENLQKEFSYEWNHI